MVRLEKMIIMFMVFFMVFFMVGLLSGCALLSSDNPIVGKSTDERIIMCLEENYPEHKFHVVESYDKQKREGTFADENGMEFRVVDVIYDNLYHFGCDDEYLYEILKQQDYTQKVETILEKYNQKLENSDVVVSTCVLIEDSLDKEELANMILEILNCVDIPTVIYPEETGFSTGEVNYYSQPKWGVFVCSFSDEYPGHTYTYSGSRFYFEDKTRSVSSIEEQIRETIMITQETDHTDEQNGIIKTVKSEFGNYVVKNGFSINEEESTNGVYLYTIFGQPVTDESIGYFIIGCAQNPYKVKQHEHFGRSVYEQLSESNDFPEDAVITTTNYRTTQGNMVYSFEIEVSDDEIRRIHYIVGNERHCLIKEVNYDGWTKCETAVEELIDSFVWSE